MLLIGTCLFQTLNIDLQHRIDCKSFVLKKCVVLKELDLDAGVLRILRSSLTNLTSHFTKQPQFWFTTCLASIAKQILG